MIENLKWLKLTFFQLENPLPLLYKGRSCPASTCLKNSLHTHGPLGWLADEMQNVYTCLLRILPSLSWLFHPNKKKRERKKEGTSLLPLLIHRPKAKVHFFRSSYTAQTRFTSSSQWYTPRCKKSITCCSECTAINIEKEKRHWLISWYGFSIFF